MIELLQSTWWEFWKILPILVIAIVVAQIIEHYLAKKSVYKKISPSEKNIARAAAIGIMTPGPLLAYFPALRDMSQKGTPPSLIASFITGQTLVGPMRLFLEISYFGLWFFVVRVIISFFMAVFIGNSFRIINKKIKLYK
ncbi:MAG: permease [bacterium]|nr:permease [bacterium]